MSNVKISQLPSYTGNTSGSWLVMNNSGETTTYKVQKETLLSGFQPSGDYATTGSNAFKGNQTITGSLIVSSSVSNGANILVTNRSTGTNIFEGAGNIISSYGGPGHYANNDILAYNGGFNTISGSANILKGPTTISGSLTVSGSTKVIGNTSLTGSLSVSGSVGGANVLTLTGSVGINSGFLNIKNSDDSTAFQYTNIANSNVLFLATTATGSLANSSIHLGTRNGTGDLFNAILFSKNTGSFIMSDLGPTGGTPSNILKINNNISGSNPAVEFKRNVEITGSVNVTSKLNLTAQNPLPSGVLGDLAVSSSNALYFHNGTSWNLIS